MVKKFLQYAIPSALSMCIASLNTVLDGVFLGKGVGDLALASVNIVMPLTILFFGLSTMVSVGGGALVSKNFGAGNDEYAIKIFRQVIKFLLIASLFLSVVCFLFAEKIVIIMGATDSLISLSAEYLRYYSIFCIPNLLGLSLSSFLRNDNRPNLAMISTIIGTMCNVYLNYLFIFKLGLGIKSAAIATGLGQMITVLVQIPHFLGKKGKLSFGKSKIEIEVIKEIIKVGFPSFVAEVAFSIIILVHNLVLIKVVGETGVSVYAIINYITTNIYLVLLGVTLGAQPLISYSFGANEDDKILIYYKLANITSLIIALLYFSVCIVFGMKIISIFTFDIKIMNMSYIALNLTNLAYFIIGINLTTTMYYQAIELPKYSNLIGALRSVLVLPIVLIFFAKLFGTNGIWVSMAVSELITSLIVYKFINIKKYTRVVSNYA